MSKILPKDKSPASDAGVEGSTPREEFTNPITKNTFEALPRIYGTRKKKKYTLKYDFKNKQKNQQNSPGSQPNQTILTDLKPLRDPRIAPLNIDKIQQPSHRRFKTQMKTYDKKYAEQLSQPRPQFCNRRYCSCKKEHRDSINKSQSKMKIKSRPSKLLSLKLPEIQSVASPDDIQSHHKVAMNLNKKTEGISDRNHFTLLDFLRGSQGQPIHQSTRPKILKTASIQGDLQKSKKNISMQYPQKMHTVSVQTQLQPQQNESRDLTTFKGHTSTLDNYLRKQSTRKIASSSQFREQVNKQNVKIDSLGTLRQQEEKLAQSDPRFKLQQMRARYQSILEQDSEQDDNKSVISSLSSGSISKHIFKTDKKNTMFHTLKLKGGSSETSSIKKKSQSRLRSHNENQKKPLFQKKSGLFVIPEEDQYVDYLKNYQPIDQKFTIKKLIRKQNFKVVPEEEGVFFGELVDQKKNGKGLMVTERSVFQGQYKNNLKYFGCQRNIDGVYKGEFLNGIREGYGTFQWYNGEFFEGEWRNGTKNGFGIWKSPRGDFYEGNWLLNRQHGKGIYKHRLSTYRGQFSQFLKSGQGQEIFSNGDKYVGSYKKGKPDGKGRYDWADGSYYEGDFSNGVREGKGKWVLNNGTVYEGQFKNDFKDGQGRQTYASGERYEGIFKEGNKYQGTLYDQHKNVIKIKSTE